jgi:methylthioribose-1-phosphate isomerase
MPAMVIRRAAGEAPGQAGTPVFIGLSPIRYRPALAAKMSAMKIDDAPTRSIRTAPDSRAVDIIDQTALPHAYRTLRLSTLEDAVHAIRFMQVRGAPLIGVTAAYGVALALTHKADDATLAAAVAKLAATRPTAVNLHWALARMQAHLSPLEPGTRADAAWQEAGRMAEEDVAQCQRIGEYGLSLLRPLATTRGRLNIMTHCNAGWLATVDYGTALAPVYAAFDAGIDVHVRVSETRPRNQGLLTAWELRQHGVPHAVIADNAAGLLLARGEVDAVIVGADRIAANGDVANKIGTYLKALAAHEAGVPFFVAAPRSTIDFDCARGAAIPIEERNGDELRVVHGLDAMGRPTTVRQIPVDAAVANPAFDITPARFVTAIITERGTCPANCNGLRTLYPEAPNA